MPLNIEVTPDYKITSDSLNVIINRKHIVDPTKSPNWAKMEAEGKSGELREDWREEKYFATIDRAMEYIVEQSVRDSNATSIAELTTEIAAIRRQISEVLRN